MYCHVWQKSTRVPSFVWRRIASGHLSARSCMATYGKMGTQVPIFAWRRTQQGTRAPFEEPRHFVGGARVRSRGPRGFRRRRSSAFEGSSGVSSEALECPSRGPRRFAEALECLRGGPRPSSGALECVRGVLGGFVGGARVPFEGSSAFRRGARVPS